MTYKYRVKMMLFPTLVVVWSTFMTSCFVHSDSVTKETVMKTIYSASKDYKNFQAVDDLFSDHTAQLATLIR